MYPRSPHERLRTYKYQFVEHAGMAVEHPFVGRNAGTVTCPVCGRTTNVGLPRHATLETVTATRNPQPDEEVVDGYRRRKCRPQVCSCGRSFEFCFTC